MKKLFATYGGILIGGIYGLIMRILIGGSFSNFTFADLFSITFIWILPIAIGCTPLILAPKEQLANYKYTFFSPPLSVLTFFILCFWTGHEDILCILIIAFPFLLVASVFGLFFGKYILDYRKKRGILYSIYLLPFLTGMIEPHFENPRAQYETKSVVVINASKDEIWKNIVRVKEIKENEYPKGFFNYAGIPRPLYAELNKDTLAGIRTGHFEGGLKFQEEIISWNKNESISFDIKIIPSKTEMSIFERHLLNSHHFHFLKATYTLKAITPTQTALQLTTNYQLETKINYYGELWGQWLLTDFQDRLLAVIKNRCE